MRRSQGGVAGGGEVIFEDIEFKGTGHHVSITTFVNSLLSLNE